MTAIRLAGNVRCKFTGGPAMQSPLLTLHDPAEARRYYEAGLWRDETLYALLARHAAERPDDFALRDARRG